MSDMNLIVGCLIYGNMIGGNLIYGNMISVI